MEIIDLASNHYSSRSGAAIRAIVIHATAGTDSRSWLVQNPNSVSTHILIRKDAAIYRMVPDDLAAHHVGYSAIPIDNRTYTQNTFPGPNQISLGVELENLNNGIDTYPDAQMLALGFVLNDWRQKYPDAQMFFHRDIDTQGKTDPRRLTWSDIRYWMAQAQDADDPWSIWRATGLPLNTNFGIEQYWLPRRDQFGAPTTDEIYGNGFLSVRFFERGLIGWDKRVGKAWTYL